MNQMLLAINSLPVEDYSTCGGECEYVLVADTPENREILLSAGFTDEQLALPEVKPDADDETLDVSWLAFCYADADWFSPKDGFSQNERTRISEPANE